MVLKFSGEFDHHNVETETWMYLSCHRNSSFSSQVDYRAKAWICNFCFNRNAVSPSILLIFIHCVPCTLHKSKVLSRGFRLFDSEVEQKVL